MKFAEVKSSVKTVFKASNGKLHPQLISNTMVGFYRPFETGIVADDGHTLNELKHVLDEAGIPRTEAFKMLVGKSEPRPNAQLAHFEQQCTHIFRAP